LGRETGQIDKIGSDSASHVMFANSRLRSLKIRHASASSWHSGLSLVPRWLRKGKQLKSLSLKSAQEILPSFKAQAAITGTTLCTASEGTARTSELKRYEKLEKWIEAPPGHRMAVEIRQLSYM
jgi:hypothetical protein